MGPTVFEHLPPGLPRVISVGRLKTIASAANLSQY
jgi:hypothetical protein